MVIFDSNILSGTKNNECNPLNYDDHPGALLLGCSWGIHYYQLNFGALSKITDPQKLVVIALMLIPKVTLPRLLDSRQS